MWGALKLPDAHSLPNLGHGSAQHKTDSSGRFKNKRLNACWLKNTKYLPPSYTGAHTHTEMFSLSYTQNINSIHEKADKNYRNTFTVFCTPSTNPQYIPTAYKGT